MTEPQSPGEFCPTPRKEQITENRGVVPPVVTPPENVAQPSTASEPPAARKLTPEEQMALYEKDLKDNDWGHQPC